MKNAAGRLRLRTALAAGGHLRRSYVQLLTPALDRLDRFLGDADKAAYSLPSPFGNREPQSYWTGWSFDRCALLAVVYPLLSLFAVWGWTGESGPIAEFLGMERGTVCFALFSTLIPSALNAVIGAVSLIGWWLPPARDWVLDQLLALDRDEGDEGIRFRVCAALALQIGAGTALTCLVLWGLWELLLEAPLVFPFVIALLKQFALALA